MHFKRIISRLLVLALVLTACCIPVLAADVAFDCTSVYCLSQDSFTIPTGDMTGIYVSDVPSAAVCDIRLGDRTIRAGDVLPVSALAELTLSPTCQREAQGAIFYRPISDKGLGLAQELQFSLLTGKNTAPVAEDSQLETYKNIENSGTLCVSDKEVDSLTYTLVREPKRGTVTLHQDGTFTYVPAENKVGKDSFVFTATDTAGNVSNEATVKIRILKPTDKATYSDLEAHQQYLAMWLKDHGVYSGRRIDGNLCFAPDEPISRGEFLIMTMALFGQEPESALLTSGFADEGLTPQWMRPYIVSAFKSGVISGSLDQGEMVFRPADHLTHAEAAVMVQSILDLPQPDSQMVFAADETGEPVVPSWAQEAVSALTHAGLPVSSAQAEASITRLEACRLLREAWLVQQAPELEAN